ncbi:hypothetical protein C1H46_028539 [Malus baccata]|uniref:phosphoserine transaminase n=1 Tax=Malus baccata TaxID=106549 RepID=A0A540LHX8_MALBA|nr:hypothetical protein C1H46_028539 [Malus baccata]
MSSNFCSKPVDVSKFGIIYAGAQKNVGPSGVTIVIIRKDLIGNAQPVTPVMLDYKIHDENKSLYNTPPCYGIYMCGLVFEDLLEQGGLVEIEKKNKRKADILYNAIDESKGFYRCPVEKSVRSLMNVPFTLEKAELEAEFVKEAAKEKMVQLKGHRSVGGMRASIYNAMPLAGVEKLVAFMKEFQAKHALESWFTNWWNTRQSEIFLNDIQEKSILKEFLDLEELLRLDEMIKEYPETHLQKPRIEIYKETIQLIKMHNEDCIHTILHFSTNMGTSFLYFTI